MALMPACIQKLLALLIVRFRSRFSQSKAGKYLWRKKNVIFESQLDLESNRIALSHVVRWTDWKKSICNKKKRDRVKMSKSTEQRFVFKDSRCVFFDIFFSRTVNTEWFSYYILFFLKKTIIISKNGRSSKFFAFWRMHFFLVKSSKTKTQQQQTLRTNPHIFNWAKSCG